MAVILAVTAAIVFMETSSRRLPIQYVRKGGGGKGNVATSYLPLKLNPAGVIPIIFAMSILAFPSTLATFSENEIVQKISFYFSPNSVVYYLVTLGFIIFFTYFYTSIIFNPDDIADNINKSGGVIPGKRPGGVETAKFIDFTLSRLTFVGAIYLGGAVAILPQLIIAGFNVPFYFGGTSILIVIGVGMDVISKIEAHLVTHNYDGFLKKRKNPRKRNDMINLIFLGPPGGAGKGTQSAKIIDDYKVVQISTGDLLRAAVKAGTSLGKEAKVYMDGGQLVPDQLIIDMMKERFEDDDCKNGFILDGFPRTTAQAEALDSMLENELKTAITHIISLEVDDEVVVKRNTGRRVCPVCGATYHIKFNLQKRAEFAIMMAKHSYTETMTVKRPFVKDWVFITRQQLCLKTITARQVSFQSLTAMMILLTYMQRLKEFSVNGCSQV